MAKTKHTKHKYYSTEEEEEAMRKMGEEKRKKTEDSQEEARQTKSIEPPLKKKKKKDKKSIKSMTKEERQKQSEELKAERKAKALQRKKAKEEKDQEKVWLKREEHKALLKRAKELLSRTKLASTVVCAEDVPSILEALSEPSTSRQRTDPLETSLVESGPLLVSLNLFPSEEEDEDEPPSVHQFKRSTVQTKTVSQITTKSYIQTPAEAALLPHLKQGLLRKYLRKFLVKVDQDPE